MLRVRPRAIRKGRPIRRVPTGAAAIGLDRQPKCARSIIAVCDGDLDHRSQIATELIALAPDVILAVARGPALFHCQATSTVPIVFVHVTDPVASGQVKSLARPGGNATGFIEYRIQHGREMAGSTKTDRSKRERGGGPSRCRSRYRSIRCNSGCGIIA